NYVYESFPERLVNNFSLRCVRSIQDDSIRPPKEIFTTFKNHPCTQTKKEVLSALVRNRNAYIKCQCAVVVLLGIKKFRKQCAPHRDAFGICIDMVWASCGLAVWAQVSKHLII